MTQKPRPSRDETGGRLDFETLVSDAMVQLMATPLEQLDSAVERTLERVRIFFMADRCALLWASADLQMCKVRFASYAEDVSPVPKDINLAQVFPWSAQILLVERMPLRLSSEADFPVEAETDRATWKLQGTQSSLAIPLRVDGGLDHLIVVQSVHAERDWPEAYVTRLRVLGDMVISALGRKDAVTALRETEDRLQRAAAAAGSGLWELDVATGSIWVTAEARRLYGLADDEPATAGTFIGRVSREDREAVAEATLAALKNNRLFDSQHRIVLPSGALRWIHARAQPDGPERLLGVSLDVTERVLTEQLAREQAARVAAAVEVAEVGFSEWSIGGDRQFVDRRMRELLGLDPGIEDPPLDFWLAHLPPETREDLTERRRKLVAGEIERTVAEYRYEHPRRGWIWLRHTVRRLEPADGSGERARLIGAVQDITEHKQMEEELRQSVSEVQRLSQRLEQESAYLRKQARSRQGSENLVGRSPAIRQVITLSEQVATTHSTVLLLGETGVGKERFASLLHELSRRRDRTMIRVNCSAIPSALMESELFGREKGAYTGALSKQIGRFELADKSTLFLDEIGDLPAEVQVKLLRVLEEHTIERLGNPRPLPVDVRIIAATHHDLARAVREGSFRADLYYRLNVFPITVPPLRDRREDIPLLVTAFLEEFSATMGKRVDKVEPASLAALVAHSWPGNVRELRNVVERAMILATGTELRVEMAPTPGAPEEGSSHLDAVESAHILQILQELGWRIRGPQGAAARLGLKPTTLESRMKKLGIVRPGG